MKKILLQDIIICGLENDYHELIKNFINSKLTSLFPSGSLVIASTFSSLKCIDLLINSGFDVNEPNQNGYTALFISIRNKDFNLFNYLLQKGADPLKESKDKTTNLMMASFVGDKDVLNALLDLGEDVNRKNIQGKTALMYACIENNLDIASILLDNGADPNEKTSIGTTVFMKAVLKGSLSMLNLLLDYGANINDVDNMKENALFKSIDEKRTNISKFLIEDCNIDINCVNINGTNSIILATKRKEYEIVRLLLKKGIDTKIKTKSNENFLSVAKNLNDSKMLEILSEFNIK